MIYRGKTTIAVPPGETIIEMMDDRGITRTELAGRIGTTVRRLDRLLEGMTAISPGTAAKLEKVFGVPAYFWLNLEAIYREDIAKIAKEKAGISRPAISVRAGN